MFVLRLAAITAGIAFWAGTAFSATVSGTFCNTTTLQGCFVSVDGDPGGEPPIEPLARTEAIVRINFEAFFAELEDGVEVNPNFPTISISGLEFDFSGLLKDDGEVTGGTVKYTLGTGDPGMTAFSTKRGDTDTLFYGDAISFDGSTMFTFDLGTGQNAVSNFVIYDNFEVIPLPAAGWLLIGALGSLVAVRRRRR